MLDLAFLSDVTSSMRVCRVSFLESCSDKVLPLTLTHCQLQGCLDMVKVEIRGMLDQICKNNPQCSVRVAFVGYADYNYPQAPFLDFTENVQSFQGVLDTVKPQYHSRPDPAEDVFSGLEAVARLSWISANRVVVHIADAPCHGEEFHDLGPKNDHYLSGDKLGRDAAELLRQLAEDCKLDTYMFCHLTEWTQKMVDRFKDLLGECPPAPCASSSLQCIGNVDLPRPKMASILQICCWRKGCSSHRSPDISITPITVQAGGPVDSFEIRLVQVSATPSYCKSTRTVAKCPISPWLLSLQPQALCQGHNPLGCTNLSTYPRRLTLLLPASLLQFLSTPPCSGSGTRQTVAPAHTKASLAPIHPIRTALPSSSNLIAGA